MSSLHVVGKWLPLNLCSWVNIQYCICFQLHNTGWHMSLTRHPFYHLIHFQRCYWDEMLTRCWEHPNKSIHAKKAEQIRSEIKLCIIWNDIGEYWIGQLIFITKAFVCNDSFKISPIWRHFDTCVAVVGFWPIPPNKKSSNVEGAMGFVYGPCASVLSKDVQLDLSQVIGWAILAAFFFFSTKQIESFVFNTYFSRCVWLFLTIIKVSSLGKSVFVQVWIWWFPQMCDLQCLASQNERWLLRIRTSGEANYKGSCDGNMK